MTGKNLRVLYFLKRKRPSLLNCPMGLLPK